MSSPILHIQGSPGPSEGPPGPIEAFRGGPPPEVLDQMALAGAVDEGLRESGRQLRFLPAGHGERTRIELHDRDDGVRILSVAETVDIAAGNLLTPRGSR
jgi:hypothetical protein